ncbi:MAG: tRNA (N6-threonylcarbamoyladenosine(37)-N6)-methyltransferase TrmO [Bacteroidales bacterium]|nr:tRNA (N6-threonylcarbamoyladenosine(37)-N6)-methyltransferase TrmO [Bacteroidales bacterium]
MSLTITPIAHISSEFPQKFGIPRQPNLAKHLLARIIFEPEFRNPDFIRGIETVSHIWLIWEFSEFTDKKYTALVRPPRLGGNKKMGVFATRSPQRPNSLAMSAVKIVTIKEDPKLGPVIYVSGADLLDGTPIYDIKPYISYTDCITEATTTLFTKPEQLDFVEFCCNLPLRENDRKLLALKEILLQDPRPAYKKNGTEKYAFEYSGMHIEFFVENNVVKVLEIKLLK